MLERSQFGLQKYGVGLNRTDLTVKEWLIHFQNELMDGAGYAQVLINQEEERERNQRMDSRQFYATLGCGVCLSLIVAAVCFVVFK